MSRSRFGETRGASAAPPWSARPAAHSAFWRHCASDCGVGCSATARGLSMGRRAAVSAARFAIGSFGADFVQQVKVMGIKQVLSAPRSPWQRARTDPGWLLITALLTTDRYPTRAERQRLVLTEEYDPGTAPEPAKTAVSVGAICCDTSASEVASRPQARSGSQRNRKETLT